MIYFLDEMKKLHAFRKFIVIKKILTKKKVMHWENHEYFSSKLQKISSKKSFL
jgi:hypothetical protein